MKRILAVVAMAWLATGCLDAIPCSTSNPCKEGVCSAEGYCVRGGDGLRPPSHVPARRACGQRGWFYGILNLRSRYIFAVSSQHLVWQSVRKNQYEL